MTNTPETAGLPLPTIEQLITEISELRRLLHRVLEANIARGCKPEHPRVGLVYDIAEALNP